MGCCATHSIHQEIEPFIIMWVLKVSDFLQMELPLSKHEELQAQGLLYPRGVLSHCIFVSHQWLSLEHPDPEGEQLGVLQKCLQHICNGTISVQNDMASQFFGDCKILSKEQMTQIREGFIWLDWVSIPQIETFQTDDPDDEISAAKRERSSRTFAYSAPARRRTDQEDFILSIPSFVQACQVFVVLVPPIKHKNSNQICNYSSWSMRGWCRTELWCKMMLANMDVPVLVISGEFQADFARPVNWVDCVPHEGEFSFSTDRGVVNSIFEQVLSHQLSWLEHEANLSLYRYFLSRKDTLTGTTLQPRSMAEFLEDFGYKSLKASKKSSFSPVAAAALSGDADVLKLLLEARCSVDKPFKGMPEVGIVNGLTTMHIAVMQAWRSPQILKILLEAKANPNLSALGVPLLACCRTAKDVELLVRYRADVCKRAWPLNVPVIALASGENTQPEVIAKLLECRASPNGPRVAGLGIAQPLAFVCLNASSNSHAVETAQLLLAARADVNQQCSASGLLYGMELLHRTYIQFIKARSLFIEATAEWSTSPLGIACLFQCRPLVELFLDAKGDVNLKNSRGRTPLQLARSEEIRQILMQFADTRYQNSSCNDLPEVEELGWKPEDWEAPSELPTTFKPTCESRVATEFGQLEQLGTSSRSPSKSNARSPGISEASFSRSPFSPATIKKTSF